MYSTSYDASQSTQDACMSLQKWRVQGADREIEEDPREIDLKGILPLVAASHVKVTLVLNIRRHMVCPRPDPDACSQDACTHTSTPAPH